MTPSCKRKEQFDDDEAFGKGVVGKCGAGFLLTSVCCSITMFSGVKHPPVCASHPCCNKAQQSKADENVNRLKQTCTYMHKEKQLSLVTSCKTSLNMTKGFCTSDILCLHTHVEHQMSSAVDVFAQTWRTLATNRAATGSHHAS